VLCIVVVQFLPAFALSVEEDGAEKEIYPLQREIEALLKDGPERAKHHAKLMPLRFLLADRDWIRSYKRQVLDELEVSEPKEVLPLLERSLAWNVSFWGSYAEKRRAIDIWLAMKTKGMGQEEKAKLLASTLMPGFPLNVCDRTREVLAKNHQNGAKVLLGTLLEAKDRSIQSGRDCIFGAATADALFEGRTALTEKDLASLEGCEGAYVSCVSLVLFGRMKDNRALTAARRLMVLLSRQTTPARVVVLLAGSIVADVSGVDGGAAIIGEVLKILRDRLSSPVACESLARALSAVSGHVSNAVLPELREELESIAALPLGENPNKWVLSAKDSSVRILRRLNKK